MHNPILTDILIGLVLGLMELLTSGQQRATFNWQKAIRIGRSIAYPLAVLKIM